MSTKVYYITIRIGQLNPENSKCKQKVEEFPTPYSERSLQKKR